MGKCEFAQPNIDHSRPTCNRSVVLLEIYRQEELEGVYTLEELLQVVCHCTNGNGVPMGCHAFADLKENGRRSSYSK